MNKITITFKKAGLQTLIQDKGRLDYQAFGVPIAGVLDKSSAQIANWLVGNFFDAPVLEMTLIGSTIEFDGMTQIAITGGHLSPKINGQLALMYQTITVKKGDILSFGKTTSGCRAYVAIRGFWKVTSWLNSFSASSFKGKTLTPNSVIKKEDQLIINTLPVISPRIFPAYLQPKYSHQVQIRVTEGPEFNHFSNRAIGYFFSHHYPIMVNSNRMGYRLNQKVVDISNLKPMISSGIVPGTVQITSSGQPIILLADAQTTGGYARLVNVISADMDKLAQLKPNDTIRFILVSIQEAYLALKEDKVMGFLKTESP